MTSNADQLLLQLADINQQRAVLKQQLAGLNKQAVGVVKGLELLRLPVPPAGHESLQLASVVPVLVQNQCLDGDDLEALAQTSKDIHQVVITNDNWWQLLCHAYHPCTNDVAVDVVEKMGFRRLYAAFSRDKNLRDPTIPPVPPPACTSADDFAMFFHI